MTEHKDENLDLSCDICGASMDCEHQHTEILAAKEATCTETGLTNGVKCTICGEILTAQQTIPALGHTEVIDNAVESTCTTTGLTQGKHCSVCNAVIIAQIETPLAAHTYDDKYDESCNECGFIRDAECAHAERETISGCAATCTSSGLTDGEKCKKCGEILVEQSIIDAFGHTYTSTVTAPTCTAQGYTTYICHCGDTYVSDYVDALGHTEVIDKAVAATCTQAGLTEGKHCSVCAEVIIAQIVIPVAEHRYDDIYDDSCNVCGSIRETLCAHTETEILSGRPATCTQLGLTNGAKCKKCGEILIAQEYIYFLPHTEVIDEAVAPTCTETGLTEGKHCSVCGEILLAQAEVATLGHDEMPHAAQTPTCTEIGWAEYVTCSRCDYTTYSEISAHGHTEVTDVADAPTCTQTGLTEGKHCSVCDEILVKQIIVEALGHTEEVDSAVAPTCTETGLTEGKHCSVCGEILLVQAEIAAHGHTQANAVVENRVEPTCTADGNYDSVIYCSACGAELGREAKTIAALGHTYTSTVTSPSCTRQGYTIYTCRCGDTYVSDYVDTLGHDLAYHDAQQPTCTDIGWNAYDECSRCDYTTYTELAALGHDLSGVNNSCTICGYIPLEYTLSEDGEYYSVTGMGYCINTEITIPSVFEGKPVTSISYCAFEDCVNLTQVIIPDSVTSIGYGAFRNCTSLESVTIPDGMTSIGAYAFSGCTSLTSITIPDSVTSIGKGAFSGCTSLQYNEYDNAYYLGNDNNLYFVVIMAKSTSVTSCSIHDDTRVIGDGAFSSCDSLKSVTIPDSVTSIGANAFSSCDSLKSVTIPPVSQVGTTKKMSPFCKYFRGSRLQT